MCKVRGSCLPAGEVGRLPTAATGAGALRPACFARGRTRAPAPQVGGPCRANAQLSGTRCAEAEAQPMLAHHRGRRSVAKRGEWLCLSIGWVRHQTTARYSPPAWGWSGGGSRPLRRGARGAEPARILTHRASGTGRGAAPRRQPVADIELGARGNAPQAACRRHQARGAGHQPPHGLPVAAAPFAKPPACGRIVRLPQLWERRSALLLPPGAGARAPRPTTCSSMRAPRSRLAQ